MFRCVLFSLLALSLAGCGPGATSRQRAAVRADFDSFRHAILERHADRITAYLPHNVGDYLAAVNAGDTSTTSAPGVNHLLRTALDRKMPPSVRAHLDLQMLLQRLADRGLLNSKEIRGLSLGSVTIKGDQATAELYYRGALLPLRLPFVRQDRTWKVDLLAMLPYAEVLMRLDRAVTGRTEDQQVAQLVQPLPLL